MSKRSQIVLYLGVALALIVTNSIIDCHWYDSGYKFHNLSAFGRNSIRVSGLLELVLSPFSGLFSLFVISGKPRDHETFVMFFSKLAGLTLSFFWYFKSVRFQLFQLLKRTRTQG